MGFFNEMNNKSALTSKITKLNTVIKDNYAELGVRYYNLFKDNPDPKFQELIANITYAYAEIKDCETRLAWLRGVVYCPKCNSECSAELRFCIKCGTQLIKPVPDPVYAPQPISQSAPASTYAQPPIAPVEPVAAPAVQPAAAFKFCTYCGSKVSAAAAFCTNCGKPLK